MKLDVNVLRYLSKDDFRVLVAVELGMRNHEIVPAALIDRIARLKHGGTYKVLKNLLKHKLVHHDSSDYDGFRLTYLGYDFLAISALVKSGVISAVGRQIGVGKESDIFEVINEDGTVMAMKLHRLGRVSFRAVKSKRDYLRHRSSFNWLYLSRLAALKEYAFMKALQDHGFPVPKAVECNRHCVIMSLVPGYPLVQVKHVQNPDVVFETVIGLIVRLAEHGLIHCDFNEFNIMIDEDENVTMIDFPQMVSVNHRNAKMYFDRDVECIFKFFRKRFKLTFELQSDEVDDQVGEDNSRPNLSSIVKEAVTLDKELAASGYVKEQQEDLDRFIEGLAEDSGSDDDAAAIDESVTDANVNELNDGDITEFDSLKLNEDSLKQDLYLISNQQISSTAPNSRKDAKEEDDKDDDDDDNDNDDDEDEGDEERCPELVKSLSKQREKAIASARGRRQSYTSRNSYKDKGGKSSRNSKIFKSGDW